MDPQTELYLRYYRGQNGGQLNAFKGLRRGQVGGSLGGIFAGLLRTLLPIAARGANTFLTETLAARDSGKGWGEAAKAALNPTIDNVIANAVKTVTQKGTGRRHRKRGATKRRRIQSGLTSSGQDGGARRRRRRRGSKRASSSVPKSHAAFVKRIKFHNL